VSRTEDVLEEFAERASWSQVGDIYSPPFRDRLPNDELGPEHCTFSYRGEAWGNSSWNRARTQWGMRPFWDPEQDVGAVKAAEREIIRNAVERPGASLLARWMRTHSHAVPKRELEVYTLFYVDGCTRARCARIMGVGIPCVRWHLLALRRRAGLVNA
jgi:hypothetical protein